MVETGSLCSAFPVGPSPTSSLPNARQVTISVTWRAVSELAAGPNLEGNTLGSMSGSRAHITPDQLALAIWLVLNISYRIRQLLAHEELEKTTS